MVLFGVRHSPSFDSFKSIIDFEDYLNRMSKYNGVTRTRYIQDLIRDDMASHKDEYEALKKLPHLIKKKK